MNKRHISCMFGLVAQSASTVCLWTSVSELRMSICLCMSLANEAQWPLIVKILKELLLCVFTDRAKAEKMSSMNRMVVDEIQL